MPFLSPAPRAWTRPEGEAPCAPQGAAWPSFLSEVARNMGMKLHNFQAPAGEAPQKCGF